MAMAGCGQQDADSGPSSDREDDGNIVRVIDSGDSFSAVLTCEEDECDAQVAFDTRYVPREDESEPPREAHPDGLLIEVRHVETETLIRTVSLRGSESGHRQTHFFANIAPGGYRFDVSNVTEWPLEFDAAAQWGASMPGSINDDLVGPLCTASDSEECADGYFCHQPDEGVSYCTSEFSFDEQCDWRAGRLLGTTHNGNGSDYECQQGICVASCVVSGLATDDFSGVTAPACEGFE